MSPTGGQGGSGPKRAAGLFLNTIPIRLDDSPVSWLDAVEHIARFERASHRYRRYPLQAMQSEAGHPVFETAFNFVNYHVFAELAGATGVELLGFDAGEQTNFALLTTAGMDPRTGRLSLRVNGDREKVTASQASEFANSFVRVLAAIVRSPERAGDYAADELAARDVAQFVSEQAAATPEANALVTDSTTWTYAELDGSAERIAAGLLAAGMPPGARVGVMLDRSPELIATVLGVLKAGAAVVPLDASYPHARIDAMIDRARPFRVISDSAEVRALLESPATTDATGDRSRECGLRVVHIGFDGGTQGRHDAAPGSGQPGRMAEPTFIGGRRRFDAAVLPVVLRRVVPGDLLDALRRRYVAAGVRVAAQGSAATGAPCRRRGDRTHILPCVALQAFAEAAYVARTRLESLRAVINVGEQLRVTPEIRWLCSANPGLVLENHYGPTETHEVASYTLSGSPEDFPTLPPIGTAIDGATISAARRRPASGSARNERGDLHRGSLSRNRL